MKKHILLTLILLWAIMGGSAESLQQETVNPWRSISQPAAQKSSAQPTQNFSSSTSEKALLLNEVQALKSSMHLVSTEPSKKEVAFSTGSNAIPTELPDNILKKEPAPADTSDHTSDTNGSETTGSKEEPAVTSDVNEKANSSAEEPPAVQESDVKKTSPEETVSPQKVVTKETPVVITSAQETTKPAELEGARPENIDTLIKHQSIDKSFAEAKTIPLPAENKVEEAMSKEETATFLSSDQILDSVIKPENKDRTMDLDFDETSLENIFRTIGDVIETNIVLDPALKANTLALHLKNVPIREALSLMADSYNLAFKKVGQSLFVTTKERIHNENLLNRVIKLRYIKAQEIKTMTHNVLESINVSEDTNSLVVVGTADEIKKVEDLVKKVDVPQPQVVLEAKIIEINKDALKDLGVDWSDAITTSYQESGRPATFSNVEDSPGQVFKLYSFARNPIQFDAVIRMLENNNKAKVLSNPRIMTLNNQESEIFVGDRIPYTITTVAGGVATTEVRFVEPGIRLKITPSIIDNDFVVIKIEPEVSFIFSFRGPQDQYPWVKTRNATAFVRVPNKQPFVLGGLLNQEDTKNYYRIPLLGQVPLLGNLFSYQKHSVIDSELIITVTPVIINGKP